MVKRSLFLILLLWSVFVSAATITMSWCPVKGINGSAPSYFICVGTPGPGYCNGIGIPTSLTSQDIVVPDNVTVAFQVQAWDTYWDSVNMMLVTKVSQYSNPVLLTGGLSPPVVSCGCP